MHEAQKARAQAEITVNPAQKLFPRVVFTIRFCRGEKKKSSLGESEAVALQAAESS